VKLARWYPHRIGNLLPGSAADQHLTNRIVKK